MAIIKPISDLRNKSTEISTLAHESDEPIYITKNGEGDMVVMSVQHYRGLIHKMDLFSKLATAQAQEESGEKGKPFKDVIKEGRKRIHARKN